MSTCIRALCQILINPRTHTVKLREVFVGLKYRFRPYKRIFMVLFSLYNYALSTSYCTHSYYSNVHIFVG